MEPRDLEATAEFCRIVGASNLVVYLGLDSQAEPETLRAKLRARRKFMQGMQANPKYKREALFLIRHFSNLQTVLQDVPAYLADAARRAESVHLPVLEMTIRNALLDGPLTPDREAYLLRNAVELGVSEATFRDLVERAALSLGPPARLAKR